MKSTVLVGCLAAALMLVATGCSAIEEPVADQVESASPQPTGSYEEVTFTSPDGEEREGRLFGDGEVAVVLSHMGRGGDGQDDWLEFAEHLAGEGLQVLTYQRRHALSETWLDVQGAVSYVRDGGAQTVLAVGASIGAMASLEAASIGDPPINGLVWLAGVLDNSGYSFEREQVAALDCPVFLASGDQDHYGAADDSRTLDVWIEDTTLLIVESDGHGTEILAEDSPAADELWTQLSDFITATTAEADGAC